MLISDPIANPKPRVTGVFVLGGGCELLGVRVRDVLGGEERRPQARVLLLEHRRRLLAAEGAERQEVIHQQNRGGNSTQENYYKLCEKTCPLGMLPF